MPKEPIMDRYHQKVKYKISNILTVFLMEVILSIF